MTQEKNLKGIQRPYIGVVGPSQPKSGYLRRTGEEVGWQLRNYLEERTGGILLKGNTVGIDVYRGIIRRSLTQDDKTTLLFPLYSEVNQSENRLLTTIYTELATLFGEPRMKRLRGSKDSVRKKLATLPNVLIVINGWNGTLNEVRYALESEIPVIPILSTGCAASLTGKFREYDTESIGEQTLPNAPSLVFPAETPRDLPQALSQALEFRV